MEACKKANVVLGKLHDITTDDYGYTPYDVCGYRGCGGLAHAASGIQPGKVTVQVTVGVTYEIN